MIRIPSRRWRWLIGWWRKGELRFRRQARCKARYIQRWRVKYREFVKRYNALRAKQEQA